MLFVWSANCYGLEEQASLTCLPIRIQGIRKKSSESSAQKQNAYQHARHICILKYARLAHRAQGVSCRKTENYIE